MKEKYIKAHMRVAYVYADLSYCIRRKVGCVIVKHNSVISIGYNGTPPNEDNCCEDEFNVTKPNVIHAEINALKKFENRPDTAKGGTMFVTTAPCIECAPEIVKAGITKVFYAETYRTTDGIEYLKSKNVDVQHISI